MNRALFFAAVSTGFFLSIGVVFYGSDSAEKRQLDGSSLPVWVLAYPSPYCSAATTTTENAAVATRGNPAGPYSPSGVHTPAVQLPVPQIQAENDNRWPSHRQQLAEQRYLRATPKSVEQTSQTEPPLLPGSVRVSSSR